MTPEEKFQSQLTDPKHADVAGHLWTLRRYAAASRTVVEMGVADGSTTLAFLLGRPNHLFSFDLWRQPEIDQIEVWAKELGVEFQMRSGKEGDSRKVYCPPCDLLYLDTDHVSETLTIELERHSPFVRRWIALHDTQTCGEYECNPADYDGPWIPPGLWLGAIGPFLRKHEEWDIGYMTHECCGLLILHRRV